MTYTFSFSQTLTHFLVTIQLFLKPEMTNGNLKGVIAK